MPVRSRRGLEAVESTGPSLNRIWAICIVSAVIVALLGWHLLGSKPARPAAASPAAAPVAAASGAVAAAAGRTVSPAAPVPAAASAAAGSRAAASPGWYVIAYTYNHEGQAQAKADRLQARRAGLHAQVITPSGHAPFLVSLGGPMSEADARATWRRARRSGMPRDTFLRHY